MTGSGLFTAEAFLSRRRILGCQCLARSWQTVSSNRLLVMELLAVMASVNAIQCLVMELLAVMASVNAIQCSRTTKHKRHKPCPHKACSSLSSSSS